MEHSERDHDDGDPNDRDDGQPDPDRQPPDEPGAEGLVADERMANAGETASGSPPSSPAEANSSSEDGSASEEGPGCMPAILAATVLMGIIGFVTCGVTTWMLYGKRTELAIRTLEETYLPGVEQSRLEPDEKRRVVSQLRDLIGELKRDQLEDWQAGGVMQRLVRTPVIQWGELNAIDAWLRRVDPATWALVGLEDVEDARRQIGRLRRAIELDQATGVDLNDVLKPVVVKDDSPLGRSLLDPDPLFAADAMISAEGGAAAEGGREPEARRDPDAAADDDAPPPVDATPADPAVRLGEEAAAIAESIVDVVRRARRVADRGEVPDREFPDVRIGTIVRRQIEAGIRDGSY